MISMAKEEYIKVMILKPNQYPTIQMVKNELENYQHLVGDTLIECIDGYSPPNTTIICSEEGKLLGMKPNRALRADNGVGGVEVVDIVCGNMIICGIDFENDGEFISLSDEQITQINSMYYNVEIFFRHNNEFYAIKMGDRIDIDSNKINLTDPNTNEVRYKIECKDDYESIRVGMAINHLKSEVLRSMEFEHNVLNVKVNEILESAVDPFSDVWDDR